MVLSPLRLALAQLPEWAGKPICGQEAKRRLLPLLFWCLCCCHFRSHSCSENIVADTQQDDLLAVIHGESSQTGFFLPLMVNLDVKFETQHKLSQIDCFDALTHGYKMRKKCVSSSNNCSPISTLCVELSFFHSIYCHHFRSEHPSELIFGHFFLFIFISCWSVY